MQAMAFRRVFTAGATNFSGPGGWKAPLRSIGRKLFAS